MALTSGWVKVFPHSPPSCHVPKPITETSSPVLPSLRYFMAGDCKRKASQFLVLKLFRKEDRNLLNYLREVRDTCAPKSPVLSRQAFQGSWGRPAGEHVWMP